MPLPDWLARSNKYLANRVIGPVAPFLPMMGVLHHVGRRSGKAYSNPVLVFRQEDDVVLALTYGEERDWVKNVLAAGRCELRTRGGQLRLIHPRVETDTAKPWAPAPVRFALNRLQAHRIMRLERASPQVR